MGIELDYMEYANDGAAQAAYPTSEELSAEAVLQVWDGSEDAVQPARGAGGSDEQVGEGFQVQKRAYITKVTLKIRKHNAPTDNIEARIETDAADAPTGFLVHANATKSLPAAGIGALAFVDFVFASGFWIEKDTQYYIVLKRSGVRDLVNLISWSVDTTVPTYAFGHEENMANGTWPVGHADWDMNFKVYGQEESLQDYSEDTIKQEGDYSLKGIAKQTHSLNETLTRTVAPGIDLSGINTIRFDIYSSRTGANVKIGIHDSGGTTSEKTHTQAGAGGWETVEWDISGVADVNKDDIDSIIVTVVNADADNTFYIDNMYGVEPSGNVIYFATNF